MTKRIYSAPSSVAISLLTEGMMAQSGVGVNSDETMTSSQFLSNKRGSDIWGNSNNQSGPWAGMNND